MLEARRPATPPIVLQAYQQPMSSPFATPVTLRQIHKVNTYIQEQLDDTELDTVLQTNIQRIMTAAEANTAELI